MVDIRIPIGLMFTIIGVLISIFGFLQYQTPKCIISHLGINVNIIMGILMLVFGLIMLFLL